jgi:hypothetical protein
MNIFRSTSRAAICQILIMFWINQNDEMSIETCLKNDFPQIVER